MPISASGSCWCTSWVSDGQILAFYPKKLLEKVAEHPAENECSTKAGKALFRTFPLKRIGGKEKLARLILEMGVSVDGGLSLAIVTYNLEGSNTLILSDHLIFNCIDAVLSDDLTLTNVDMVLPCINDLFEEAKKLYIDKLYSEETKVEETEYEVELGYEELFRIQLS